MDLTVTNALKKYLPKVMLLSVCIFLTSCTSNTLPIEAMHSKNYGQRIKKIQTDKSITLGRYFFKALVTVKSIVLISKIYSLILISLHPYFR
jgi:hypothetical protein